MRKRESEREKETYEEGMSNWNYIQSISKSNIILIIDNLSLLINHQKYNGWINHNI